MCQTNFVPWNDQIYDQLTRRVVTIKFIKKDHSERLINCTINLDLVRPDKHPINKAVYDHTNVIRVYDVDKEDWRTVNKNTIVSYE